MTEYEWVTVTNPGFIQGIEMPEAQRKRPNQQCPHCGEYQLEEWRHFPPEKVKVGKRLFGLLWKYEADSADEPDKHYKECQHCDYYAEVG